MVSQNILASARLGWGCYGQPLLGPERSNEPAALDLTAPQRHKGSNKGSQACAIG